MSQQNRSVLQRQVAEWIFTSQIGYENPFTDVTVDVRFTGPDGSVMTVPAFYDSEGTWKVRFNPPTAGEWRYQNLVNPPNASLDQSSIFTVTPAGGRGFLRATPGQAWGGSEQAPQFDRFNLDYFNMVDNVVQQAETLGIGLEMITEAWGFEFPFNSRQIFVPEWEELWMRYLIARYDAYNCLYFWTPLNEYEFYPNGDWHYKPVADRWAMRVARYIKQTGPHGHIVSVHNGPRKPAFAHRFALNPGAVDAVMFQHWGSTGSKDAWLAAGIEDQIGISFKDWWGSAVFAEWGYERNPAFDLLVPGHQYCDPEHTRRGAWRGAFCGLGVIHGFENSWGPWMLLEEDQPGLAYLLHLRRFFTEIVPFALLRPAPEVIRPTDQPAGYQPLVLVST